MKLWIANVAPETSDKEIHDLVAKYVPSLDCKAIQRVDGDGSRPAVVLEFENAPSTVLEAASSRLNGIYWKERTLLVQVLRFE